jgi:pyrimidine operon attenuation protein/uracil phosphoribosyltransferase
MSNNCILTAEQAELSIRRIAYQIYELNEKESTVIIAGIMTNGNKLAEAIATKLKSISDLKVINCQVHLDKKNPRNPVKISLDESTYKNKSVIIVDDVLHSGSTLIYTVCHFLQVPLEQCKVAVMINRNHKKFPIKADFKGISLSTSMHEHVEVVCNDKGFEAFLV